MNLQIFGTHKNQDTRAAERFFRERGVTYQFVDLTRRELGARELEAIIRAVGAQALIDTESPSYRARGMQYLEFDPTEELASDPLLMRQPVVRAFGGGVTVGLDTATWQRWLLEDARPAT